MRLLAHQGNSMLELLAVIALGALLVAGLASMTDATLDQARAQQSARHHAELTGAAARYLADRQKELAATLPDAGNALALQPDALRDAGYLPAEFKNENTY